MRRPDEPFAEFLHRLDEAIGKSPHEGTVTNEIKTAAAFCQASSSVRKRRWALANSRPFDPHVESAAPAVAFHAGTHPQMLAKRALWREAVVTTKADMDKFALMASFNLANCIAYSEAAANEMVAAVKDAGGTHLHQDGTQSNRASPVTQVIITAQKREERSLDVPAPITAINLGPLVQQEQVRK